MMNRNVAQRPTPTRGARSQNLTRPLGFALLSFATLLASGLAQTPAKEEAAECPVMSPKERHTAAGATSYGDWWPNQLNLSILHQNSPAANPLGADFDYAAAFNSLDLNALRKDIAAMLTTSQDWWPADYGNYGPLFIRLAWHSAGTYRTSDGRGGAADGTIRFAPLNSWPDNGNLDKARRLLWPIKKKYGNKISWADLMVFTGNVALETMGFQTFGFAGGREDVFEPQNDVNWGPESEWLGDKRHAEGRMLSHPLAASQMGLIYVNPEGPNGKPDPLAAAKDIRVTFGRMAMNDEETVALIAGGHTLGKTHGAAEPGKYVGPEPEGASLEEQGLGWKNSFGKGNAEHTITSGLEGAWTSTPVRWSHEYFFNLFEYEWTLTKSPAGGWQWTPKDAEAQNTVPDAHIPGKKHAPMMFTTDLALRDDPIYGPISRRFYENPKAFNEAFARAWYKLTHRDMGPHSRLLGKEVAPPQLWQDPMPQVDHELIVAQDVDLLKKQILASGLSVRQLVATAFAAASSYRDSDKRGGINGARLALAPQKDWAANEPMEVRNVLSTLERIQKDFNRAQTRNKKVSLADLIALGGAAAVEEAARRAGHTVHVPFYPGRTDATQDMTDVESFAVLEPKADGFRNYAAGKMERPLPEFLVDKAHQLTLSAPEMTVLVGGLRVLHANHNKTKHGVFTDRPEVLTNDFFKNLLDMSTQWKKAVSGEEAYVGVDRGSGAEKWTATSVDLVFGSNSQLRAIAEIYASDDAERKFVDDFVQVWTKVLNLDRFDLPRSLR